MQNINKSNGNDIIWKINSVGAKHKICSRVWHKHFPKFKQRPLKGKRLWLQGTRKIECQAHVEVRSFTLYPDFALSKDEKEGSLISKWRLQCLQEERITSLKTELAKGQPVRTLTRSFISLPSEEAHSGHPTGQPAVYGQKLHPLVAQKIAEMVAAGTVDTAGHASKGQGEN